MAHDGLSSQGIISYPEKFLFLENNEKQETESKRAYLNLVIMHELAH
jgi:aminopeptidase N